MCMHCKQTHCKRKQKLLQFTKKYKTVKKREIDITNKMDAGLSLSIHIQSRVHELLIQFNIKNINNAPGS